METVTILVVLAIAAVLAGMVVFAILFSRKEKEGKAQMAQTLFQARYAIISPDPEAVRRFFDEDKARYFANTEYYTLHASGDLFTFAEIEPGFKVNDPARMTRRINRALEIYRLFQG